MKKPSLKEFDITVAQYAKYQDYKSKIDDRKREREEFDHRFNEAIISAISIILPLLLVIIGARTALFNTVSQMLGDGKFGGALLIILVFLFLCMLLFFVIRMFIAKPLRPKLERLKTHRPFKKLYIKLQGSIPQESYFDNAKKYELQNKAYYNYIGDLQQRFPDIIELDYDLQQYLKKIIDEIISYEHIEINNSIINQELEKRRAAWLQMDGITFEREVANIYSAHGYETKITKATGEGGVDIRLWKEDEYSIAQCKNVGRQIDEPAIKKLLETMHKEKAVKAILICSGDFTPKARDFVKWKPIELLNLNQFLKLVNQIYPQEYQLVDAISETSVKSTNTTYTFKVIGKAYILYSTHSQTEEANYCLFETSEEAKRIIRRLQRIETMPHTNLVVYEAKEWWLKSTPSDYYQKALYYIKVSEKEMKACEDKKKDKTYVQRKLWDIEEKTQRSVYNPQ